MVDPLNRRTFDKPTPGEMHFLGIVKMVRHELGEFCKTLFFETDLQKRREAFEGIKNLPIRFAATLKEVSPEQKNELLTALQLDSKKVENALKSIAISNSMEVDGIHVPIHNQNTNKAFTLFDFFTDDHMLSDKAVVFQYHAIKFHPHIVAQSLPGLDDPELQAELKKNKKGRRHTIYSHSAIQYDIAPSNPAGSYNITGKCLMKNLSHLAFEIPRGAMPGDLYTSLDRILVNGGRHG